MDLSTLLWSIDPMRGTVQFGRLIPFAGNTYELVFTGVDIEKVYTAYVMDTSGLKCLAKSTHDAGVYTIAFNTKDLRDEFSRDMHEVRTFHVLVRDEKRVVAEGDLSVQWQSLWEDTTTGEVFTMKGEKGNPGSPGRQGDKGNPGSSAYELACQKGFVGTLEEWLKTLKGNPGSLVRVQALSAENEETGLWHNVFIKADQNGRLRLVVDKEAHKPDASSDVYVSTDADMSIGGVKSFFESPNVPVVSTPEGEVDTEDESNKAVNTSFLKAWWRKVCESDIVRTGSSIFRGLIRASGGIASEDDLVIATEAADKTIYILSGDYGDNGAELELRGAETLNGGAFVLWARNGDTAAALQGLPDGRLEWNGKNVVTEASFKELSKNFALTADLPKMKVVTELPQQVDENTFYFVVEE